MTSYALTHPDACLAVWLAYRLRGADSAHTTRILNESGCPRGLFVLATVLLAATAPGAITDLEA
jgi:hypothetical protein